MSMQLSQMTRGLLLWGIETTGCAATTDTAAGENHEIPLQLLTPLRG